MAIGRDKVWRRMVASAMGGLMIAGLFETSAKAQELMPAGFINVVQPDFGTRIGGGDYGLANLQPLEAPGVTEEGIRIVRPVHLLHLSSKGEARFQVLLGDIDMVYFWIESPSAAAWRLSITAHQADGFRKGILGENVPKEELYAIRVPPRSRLEFRVSPTPNPFELSTQFRLTVSPVNLTLLDAFRPIPYTIEQRVAP